MNLPPATDPPKLMSNARQKTGINKRIDRFGAFASMLCAIHCALLPVVFGVLPALGLGFLANHVYEQIFVGFAILLASISLWFGLRKHGSYLAFWFLVPGIVLLVYGMLIGSDHANSGHAVVVSIGGTLVAISHLANLRLNHVHGPNCDHA
ncbi:MerC domain-containing protein [Dokdonella sp.]|uniref:MerC domain-containing protein n=1 Tax=Dokdonella sp. TaxID=2291710 RepID=UPI003C4C2AC5